MLGHDIKARRAAEGAESRIELGRLAPNYDFPYYVARHLDRVESRLEEAGVVRIAGSEVVEYDEAPGLVHLGGEGPQPSVVGEGRLLGELHDERIRSPRQRGIGPEEGIEEVGPLQIPECDVDAHGMPAAHGHLQRRGDDEVPEVLLQPEPARRREVGFGGNETIADAEPGQGLEEAHAVATNIVDRLEYGGQTPILDVLDDGGSARREVVVGRAALAVRSARIGGDAIRERGFRFLDGLICAFAALTRSIRAYLGFEAQGGPFRHALRGEGTQYGRRDRAGLGAARVDEGEFGFGNPEGAPSSF